MASSTNVENENTVAKTSIERSETEISPKYNVDGVEEGEIDDTYHGYLGFTHNDQKDMSRMGKEQKFRRNYRLLSAISLAALLQTTWECLLIATTQGLIDGGVAGLLWSYIWTFVGMSLVMFSLAEMASMAPTSGGQYHWVSEFAPSKYQKLLSYIMGWMATLSWQAGSASGPFLVGTLIQTMVSVNNPNYSGTAWQGTLMVFAITFLVYVLNVWGSRAMPLIQNIMLFVHIFAFLTFVVIFWVLSPRNTAQVVFTEFTNDGGWSSMGLSLMVGQISALYSLISSDGAAHMSEEVKEAGVTVPRAMVWSYLLNGFLGLVFLISYLFAITDLESALDEPNGYPFLWVLGEAVSTGGVLALSFLVMALFFIGVTSFNLSTSRQTWAFARDRGLPFSGWIAHVDPKLDVPKNAVGLTCIITILLTLINLGSEVAFNAIISLNIVSLMLTYAVSIGCVLYRRLRHPELLPHGRWHLGVWGVPVNLGALLYSLFAFFWCFWPNATPVALDTFNWSLLMFFAIFIFSLMWYWFRGSKQFTGPVVLVGGWRRD